MFKKLYPDFPFECTLTKECEERMGQDGFCDIISGYTKLDGKEVAFKAAFPEQIHSVEYPYEFTDYSHVESIYNEEKCLEILDKYNFVPEVFGRKKFGKYVVVYFEKLNATSLNEIHEQYRWQLSINKTFEHLLDLYEDERFVFGNLCLDDIMIDNNDKVYLRNFCNGKFCEKQYWNQDLISFIRSIAGYESRLDENKRNKLLAFAFGLTYRKNNFVDDYKRAVKDFIRILSD